jgi:hypothetical protein
VMISKPTSTISSAYCGVTVSRSQSWGRSWKSRKFCSAPWPIP